MPTGDIFIYLAACEAIIFLIPLFYWNRASKRLTNYLKMHFKTFYNENLAVLNFPVKFLILGDPNILIQQIKATKTIYFGNMPDGISISFQKKIKFYMIIMVFWFILFAVTIFGIPIIVLALQQ